MKRGEMAFSAASAAFFAFFLWQSLKLFGQGRPGEVGSGLWPFMSLAAATLLSLAMLISNIRSARQDSGRAGQPETAEEAAERSRWMRTVALCMVCLLVYIVAMPLIGFLLSTLLFIPSFAWVLGERRRLVLLVSPFMLTGLVIAVFARFITIPFPKGMGVFAELSRWFH